MIHVPWPALSRPVRQSVDRVAAELRHRHLRLELLEVVDPTTGHVRCKRCGFQAWQTSLGLRCFSCGVVTAEHICSAPHRLRADQGAILILFALMLIPLLLVMGLVLDTGLVYLARSQAQNAADAGALAGAACLRDDDPQVDVLGPAEVCARDLAARNLVTGQAPTVTAIVFSGPPSPVAHHPVCCRVDVSQTFPTLLMGIVGINASTVRAMAEACAFFQFDPPRVMLTR